jgi:putative alpha-1,2-mannosidase
LPNYGGGSQSQFYSNGEITVSADGKQYQGYGVYRGAFSNSKCPSRNERQSVNKSIVPAYQIYYCGEFDSAPTSSRAFSGRYDDPYWPSTFNEQPIYGNSSTVSSGHLTYQYGDRVGAIFSFSPDTTTLKSKVAISWKSTDLACQNLASEIPHWNLTDVVTDAKQLWNDNVLGKITTTDLLNQTRLEMFYTGLYHTHLMPTDKTGENPHWETTEPTYDDYYTFWDTFRCLNSLMLLISPDRAAGIIRSAIDIWRHENFMPDARSGFYNGQVQGGSNADNVLADAYVKGLQMGINWTEGLAAMKTDAELTPYNTFDPGDTTCSTKEGRGALPDWLNVGWITPTYSRSLSRTVEYSLNDFAVAQVAKGIEPESYQKYLNRSA